MPIYEYQCSACGHKLESIQKMTDKPLTDCPQCHAPTLQKLISAAGFQLKGTGWYATDFRDKGKKETKSEAKQDDSSGSGQEKKDSKTDTGSSSNSSDKAT